MVVFGHAGERDPASRPAMGRIAAELSDYTIISMDDPLHEDPVEIASVIADGATAVGAMRGRDFDIDIDRASAIRRLIERAHPGDTILLAGKGHERRMLIKDERRPWNDREEAERALAEAGYGELA
jgi:UDP-N-acetylmuramoyl-L-alanyl-D-glutamate--2,6-diaminopimelate ligase